MITMVSGESQEVPAISCPEVLSDIDDVRTLRDALSEMLEIILYDDDLSFCTPNNHLYIVANIINVLTHDIEEELTAGRRKAG